MQIWFRIGAGLAGLGVILGAFGAHGLREHLTPQMLAIYETGVRYQMFHALALLIIGVVPRLRAGVAGSLFVTGIVLFSGTLYAYSITAVKAFAMITPIGGLCFIAGWVALALAKESSG
ncbi:MAG: DUF423 domain-containing protein [Candidatus Xenobia bacterium]